MAKKMCICAICGESFDRNSIQAVRHNGRRYSHATCEPDNTDFVPMEVPSTPIKKKKEPKPKKVDPAKEEMEKLKDYINHLYGDKANWAMIMKQIKSYQKEYNYTLNGILKSLMWFYEVKGNSPEEGRGGIGIVPYCYRDAYNYYYSIFIANQANQNKSLDVEIKEIVIPPPKARKFIRRSIINLDRWELPTDEEQ